MVKLKSKLKAFGYAFIKSCTSVDYYRDVLETKPWFSIKYFLMLSTLLSLVLTTRFAIVQMPEVKKNIYGTGEFIQNLYPEDLVFTLDENGWAINKPEPFAVVVAESDQDKPIAQGFTGHKNLIVFDHSGTIDKLEEYDTYLLVNGKNIIAKEDTNLSVQPISELNIPYGTYTKQDFVNFEGEVLKYTGWVSAFAILFTFMGLLLFFVVIVGSNMYIIGLPVWFFGQVTKFKGNSAGRFAYWDAVKISMHAATLPLIGFTLAKLAGLDQYRSEIAFWAQVGTLAVALIVIAMLNKADKKKTLPVA